MSNSFEEGEIVKHGGALYDVIGRSRVGYYFIRSLDDPTVVIEVHQDKMTKTGQYN